MPKNLWCLNVTLGSIVDLFGSDLSFKVDVTGNDWKDLVMEATTEVLKLGSFPVAHLFQALLQFVDKMNSRSVRFKSLQKLLFTVCQDGDYFTL